MTAHPQLDSAAAAEVAAFCWPGEKWEVPRDFRDEQLAVVYAGYNSWSNIFDFEDWDDLHRAAAVLAERGFGQQFLDHAWKAWPALQGVDDLGMSKFFSWWTAASADAWARAILATVREVSAPTYDA